MKIFSALSKCETHVVKTGKTTVLNERTGARAAGQHRHVNRGRSTRSTLTASETDPERIAAFALSQHFGKGTPGVEAALRAEAAYQSEPVWKQRLEAGELAWELARNLSGTNCPHCPEGDLRHRLPACLLGPGRLKPILRLNFVSIVVNR
jgi:hypothetical protein